MRVFKGIIRAVVGIIFGSLVALAFAPALAAFHSGSPDNRSTAVVWVVVLATASLVFFAPSIRRAFGRGFLAVGAAVFALPLSAMLLSGRTTSDMMAASSGASAAEQAGTAIGAGLAGLAFTGISAFVGFFLGMILIVIGLVLALGGRREVIVVNALPAGRKEPRL